MRFIRLIFVAILALVLVAVALANRQPVLLKAFPADMGRFLGGSWALELPLFLIIFVAFAVGMLAGLIWEWLREAHYRRAAKRGNVEVNKLESEVDHLRERHKAPKDDVVAILEAPSAPKSRTSLPAR
ncbi:LapA family protein [Paracoccus sp. 1_MG-2023]|uniref:LapA family protein n=1 Tax=unclassified Paracoccus (in: a-proteobacteria) TaxID=2688777 RepID=UPI001C0A3242|nr:MULTISPECIES: LapA family protein [unclassified Paracoccus (in: a-proteobacteria)]MBU2958622.1 LapA family protein [Paracoccus sp. C2R09]MDO6667615.1 LapA family protein [Paracoccus sp. 1_MG-2023]